MEECLSQTGTWLHRENDCEIRQSHWESGLPGCCYEVCRVQIGDRASRLKKHAKSAIPTEVAGTGCRSSQWPANVSDTPWILEGSLTGG